MPYIIPVPDINGEALLQAIAYVETVGGKNNCPRFEASWMPDGEVRTIQGRLIHGNGRNVLRSPTARARWARWGMASAASYGPWQILYQTAADLGYDGKPWELWDENISREWATKLLDRIVHNGARTVEEIADAWNSGTHKDKNIVPEYRAKVLEAYHRFTDI